MKPCIQKILIGLASCIALILIFSLGLSWVINDALAKLEMQGNEFLPIDGANSSENQPP